MAFAGIRSVRAVEEKKRVHIQVSRLLEEMVEYTESYKYYGNTGGTPQDRNQEDSSTESILYMDFSDEEGPKDIKKSSTDSQKEPSKNKKGNYYYYYYHNYYYHL